MVFARILLYLSVAIAFLFVISGYGYQWNLWEMGLAFSMLRYAAYGAIGVAVISVPALWFLRDRGAKTVSYLVFAFLITASAAVTALYWQHRANSVPPIHDITTDLNSPPEFVAMVRLREDAPNPPEYDAEESSDAQREAYPHIEPLMVDMELQEVMDIAVVLVADRGWQLVAINRNDGRIEATEKLPWFGFKDDVLLRFTEENGSTRVDMRSKSRIGRSDLGVNAKRIEQFLDDLESRVSN